MRYIKFLIWASVGIILVLFAISNNQIIQIRFFPDNLSVMPILKPVYSIPLFVLLYTLLVVGLIFGFFFEYVRERKYRVKLRQNKKDINLLQMQLQKLKSKNMEGDPDILSLIDKNQY